MQEYQKLQKLYLLADVNENCVDIDFAYAFICAMASSELELAQWLPLLFTNQRECFSDENTASEFARVVLAIYENTFEKFKQQDKLCLPIGHSTSSQEQTINQFANGYIQALTLIDNVQNLQFLAGSTEDNLQQTCILLLDKLATTETDDPQKLALFELLPSESEIITLLPTLLGKYGMQCLVVDK